MALRFNDPAPWEFWRWRLARDTGWTLEYIDGLSLADVHQFWQVTDGEGKAGKAHAEQAQRSRARRKR